MQLSALVVEQLEHAREQTLAVLAPLDDDTLRRQVSPLMSPLCWDLAHIAHYEELWLLRGLSDTPPTDPRFDDLYDAFRHPRRERAGLAILEPAAARRYASDVHDRVLELLDTGVLDRARAGDDCRLLHDGFVFGMVVQHEHQHRETMLATIGLLDRPYPLGVDTAASPRPAAAGGEVSLRGGSFLLGSDTEPWAYDNERPGHPVELAPFRIDVTPVPNGDYRQFVDAGGYDDERLWTRDGWSWRHDAKLEHPAGWHRDGANGWQLTRFGHRVDLPADEPVQHVCWYEADAFARWAGKRLPSEAEWEFAASWTPEGGKHRYPWGDQDPTPTRANLGHRASGPRAVGTLPDGASPDGVLGLVGDVWEWTGSRFGEYPGFEAFPYREYSEVFFGDEYRVLRGGSWATHPSTCRATFRNWDYPIRRQIFAGFRCARDD